MGMTRLTYDYEGRHFCDYPTREIINRLAECEIMLEKIEEILKDIPYGGEATVRRIQEVVEDGNND